MGKVSANGRAAILRFRLQRKARKGRPKQALAVGAPPLTRKIIDVFDNSGLSYATICLRAGVDKSYISRLKANRSSASITLVEACLNVCGKQFVIGDKNT